MDHHLGAVRAAEPQEILPLLVRLSVGRLLEEAGLDDVRRDGGLYVALWRSGADAWRRELAVRPSRPQRWGPMRSWWRCTSGAWRLRSGRIAQSHAARR